MTSAATGRRRVADVVTPNDNRHAAGRLRDGALSVSLEARKATWYPEGSRGVGLPLHVWAEPGKAPQNPGPLIRVRSGTIVNVSIRNSLAKPLTVFGLGGTRGKGDSVVIAPSAVREVRFTAGEPGTYYYFGKTGPDPNDFRSMDDTQLNGALVIDPPGTGRVPSDRVFVLSWWFAIDSTSKTGLRKATMGINGLSWPHTERIDLTQGDSARWRVINLTAVDHPMHLHGFYFRLDASGDGARDTLFAPDQRRMEVTELLPPQSTMAMSWSPTRAGNWIFHCHFASHISTLAALDGHEGKVEESTLAHHGTDAPHQMFGLVLGIRVKPKPGVTMAGSAPARPIRLLVRSKENVYGKHPGFAFVLGGSPQEADRNTLIVPGPALVLERGQPVAINIVNQSHEPAAIHWHGIELESYPDGVPGWSGAGSSVLKPVPPGDSLTVRFTPPRAGTFMYHSHFNEMDQISSGLYGPIIVLDRGQRYDPETDHVLLLSEGGPTVNVIAGPFPPKFLNGRAAPDTLTLRTGVTHRFRVINISDGVPTFFKFADGDKPIMWRAVAKDGADLPSSQATVRPAILLSDPGEIYDFQLTPSAPGALTFTFGLPPFIPPPPGYKAQTMPVQVR
jgi:FtsP/CotA-like multicopper oxidase with cupredoxin domain